MCFSFFPHGSDCFFLSFLSVLEYCYKYLADNTGDMASCMTVYDLKGLDKSLFFGAKKALLKKTMKIMEQHYPERSHKMYILNGPGWFNWLAWPMATQMASQQTLEKVKNFGSNFEKFTEDLVKYVDKDQIPEHFGGSNPLPLAQSVVRGCGCVVFCCCCGLWVSCVDLVFVLFLMYSNFFSKNNRWLPMLVKYVLNKMLKCWMNLSCWE